jgi:uncharacterized membrane protein
MNWARQFRLRQYWKNNLWAIPVLCANVGGALAFASVEVDRHWIQFDWLSYDEGVSTAILAALLGATVTFSGFVFTMLLLVPQFGGSQLSARVLQLAYRDARLKLTFGVFFGTLLYIFVVLSHMRGGFVPSFSLWVAGWLVFLSILIFLTFVSYFVQQLRPATAAATIEAEGRKVIDRIYTRPYASTSTPFSGEMKVERSASQVVRHRGPGGVVLAIDGNGLVETARKADCVLMLSLAVGDYLSSGNTLVEVYGTGPPSLESEISAFIAIGAERTFEQDPSFALRILVDISTKALSPGINDPTTASNVLDRIEDVLMMLVARDLRVGELRDASGALRVVVPMPTWEEFLAIAVTEIRQYGFNSIQIVRRLRRMLEDLREVAPEEYQSSLKAELAALDQCAARGFPEESDLALAGVGNSNQPLRRASAA